MTTRAYVVAKVNNHKFIGEDVLNDGDYLGLTLDNYYTNCAKKVHDLFQLGTMYSIGKSLAPSPLVEKYTGSEVVLYSTLKKKAKSKKEFNKLYHSAFSDNYSIAMKRDNHKPMNSPKTFSSYQDVINHMPYMDASYIYLYDNPSWYVIFDGMLGDLSDKALTIKQTLYDKKQLKKITKAEYPLRKQNLINNIKKFLIWLKFAKVSRHNIIGNLDMIGSQLMGIACDYPTHHNYQKIYDKLAKTFNLRSNTVEHQFIVNLTHTHRIQTVKRHAVKFLKYALQNI